MSARGGPVDAGRVIGWALIGAVAGLAGALLLRVLSDTLAEDAGRIILLVIAGAVIGGLAAALVGAERRDGRRNRRGRTPDATERPEGDG